MAHGVDNGLYTYVRPLLQYCTVYCVYIYCILYFLRGIAALTRCGLLLRAEKRGLLACRSVKGKGKGKRRVLI